MKYSLSVIMICLVGSLYAQNAIKPEAAELIYGRKDGLALTLFVQAPLQASNGKGIILVESGNWKTSYEKAQLFLERSSIYRDKGYTVFTVLPGSQPRYTIPDQLEDLKRAVRFIRYNAKTYGIDGTRLGITGYSSGGHLSLAVAMAGDKIDSLAKDPVDRVSSRVQAVAVFYPPTDFLNFGKANATPSANRSALIMTGVYGAFDFKAWNDTTRSYVTITDDTKKLEIARQVSPIYSVSSDDPPVMIIHGDKDYLVPLQQSESFVQKLEAAKVPNHLIIKQGGGHGWKDIGVEEATVIGWFDKYLK